MGTPQSDGRPARAAINSSDAAASGAADEYDAPAEVDAVFRTQRRIAIGYFLVFVGGLVLIPLATLATVWWGDRLTGWAPGFVIAGAGMYVFFFLLALGASTLANGVERRMLGSPHDEERP